MTDQLPSPSSSSKRKAQPIVHLNGSSPFVPAAPTSGMEAAEAWGMTGDLPRQTMLKVLRPIPGSRSMELLAECPMLDWSMRDSAREFGPGVYLIKPGGGRYKDKQFTIQVSEEYARKNGWNEIEPQPLPSTQLGLELTTRATREMGAGPMGVMLETVLRPVMEELRSLREKGNGGGFDMMKFMEMQETMRQNSRREMLETMELLGKVRGDLPIGGGDEEQGGMMANLGKGLGAGIGSALLNLLKPSATVQAAGAPSTQGNQLMQTTAQPEIWSPAELQVVGPLVAGLRQNSALLRSLKGVQSQEAIADSLWDRIEPSVEPAVLLLAAKAEQVGPQALAVVEPAFADSFWVGVVMKLREFIMQPDSEDLLPPGSTNPNGEYEKG